MVSVKSFHPKGSYRLERMFNLMGQGFIGGLGKSQHGSQLTAIPANKSIGPLTMYVSLTSMLIKGIKLVYWKPLSITKWSLVWIFLTGVKRRLEFLLL